MKSARASKVLEQSEGNLARERKGAHPCCDTTWKRAGKAQAQKKKKRPIKKRGGLEETHEGKKRAADPTKETHLGYQDKG